MRAPDKNFVYHLPSKALSPFFFLTSDVGRIWALDLSKFIDKSIKFPVVEDLAILMHRIVVKILSIRYFSSSELAKRSVVSMVGRTLPASALFCFSVAKPALETSTLVKLFKVVVLHETVMMTKGIYASSDSIRSASVHEGLESHSCAVGWTHALLGIFVKICVVGALAPDDIVPEHKIL